jgi:hypothetical protein
VNHSSDLVRRQRDLGLGTIEAQDRHRGRAVDEPGQDVDQAVDEARLLVEGGVPRGAVVGQIERLLVVRPDEPEQVVMVPVLVDLSAFRSAGADREAPGSGCLDQGSALSHLPDTAIDS